MRRDLVRKIERHLDQTLGLWTRLLPWRREIVTHIEDAYAAAGEATASESVDEEQWQQALARFGDIRGVADELRKEYRPRLTAQRVVAFAIAVSLVVYATGARLVIYANVSCLFPLALAGVALLLGAYRGSSRWDRARLVGILTYLGAAMSGACFASSFVDTPEQVGPAVVVSILSGFYCVVLFSPGPKMALAFAGIMALDMAIVFVVLNKINYVRLSLQPLLDDPWLGIYGDPWLDVYSSITVRTIAICLAGVFAGAARFGTNRLRHYALTIGAGVLCMNLINVFCRLGDPTLLCPDLLVALVSLPLAAVLSVTVCGSSHYFRRILAK